MCNRNRVPKKIFVTQLTANRAYGVFVQGREKVAGDFLPLELQRFDEIFTMLDKSFNELLKHAEVKSWGQDLPSIVPLFPLIKMIRKLAKIFPQTRITAENM